MWNKLIKMLLKKATSRNGFEANVFIDGYKY